MIDQVHPPTSERVRSLNLSNVASATLLLFACFHALSHTIMYMMSLIKVIKQGEERTTKKQSSRSMAIIYLLVYLTYNVVLCKKNPQCFRNSLSKLSIRFAGAVLCKLEWIVSRLFMGQFYIRSEVVIDFVLGTMSPDAHNLVQTFLRGSFIVYQALADRIED